MIGLIRGMMTRLDQSTVLLMTGGVGYEVHVGRKYSAPESTEVTLYTHLIHREDGMTLYGFPAREQKELFIVLMSAQGIGPKLAMEIISTFNAGELMEILFSQDAVRLTAVPGMGMKKAEKAVFELKDKIQKLDIRSSSSAPQDASSADAVRALSVLGFSVEEAVTAVRAVKKEHMTSETVIKEALSRLASR
ncbi:MAG: Holliday junction branch migration protein RuvA [Spirochaetota bacterium]